MKFITALLFLGLFLLSFTCTNKPPLADKLAGKWYTKHQIGGKANLSEMYPEGTQDVYSYYVAFDLKKGFFEEDHGCYTNENKYKLKDSTITISYDNNPKHDTKYTILQLTEDKLVLYLHGEYARTTSYTRQPNGNRVLAG